MTEEEYRNRPAEQKVAIAATYAYLPHQKGSNRVLCMNPPIAAHSVETTMSSRTPDAQLALVTLPSQATLSRYGTTFPIAQQLLSAEPLNWD